MASITEVARLAGVSAATASRVVSASDYPVSTATRERVLEAARTLDYVPNALARGLLKSRVPVVAVIVHDITDPYFAEVVRGVEDAASGAGFLVITCSSERDAERERSYVRLLRSIRAAAVVFAGSGLDEPKVTEEIDRHLAAMRADGAAIVHCRRRARPADVGVDNPPGSRRWWRLSRSATAGSRSCRTRGRCSSPGPGWRAIARASRTPGSRSTSGWWRTSFDAEGGALGVDTLLAAAPFTAIGCANDLLALGALGRLAELGIAVPARCRWPASTTSIGGADLAQPVDGPPAAARDGPARVRPCDPGPRRARAGREVLPTEVVLRDPPRPPARRRSPDGRGAGRPGRTDHGQQPRIGAEVAVKAAAEGAVVAVHYPRRSPRPRHPRAVRGRRRRRIRS